MSFSKDQLALQAHIERENAKTQEWVDAAEGRWATTVVSDPAHWAGYDITTIAQYEHHMAAAEYVDYYKDVNGIKPRWIDFSGVTTQEIYNMMERLSGQAAAEQEWIEYCDEIDAEKEAFEAKFADPEPSKYELLAEQAGY